MDEIVNTFLLAVDKYMAEMHLRQSRFIYSTCGPFTKNKERIQKFKERENSRFIYKNDPDRTVSMTWVMGILKIFLEEQS